jgi:hypothetical protein
LHFDGTNGSTVVPDTAFGLGTNLVWTCVGNSLSTASKKFGTASLLNGVNQYITTPDNAAFNSLGTTPFVFDFWINPSIFGSQLYVAGIGFRSTTFSFYVVRDVGNTFSFIVPGTISTTTGTITSAGLHHIACIADGTKTYIALDGVVSAGVAYSSLPNTAGPFDIGTVHFSAGVLSLSISANIDEARLSIGTTRGWTSNFTPFTTAYTL